jgi:hypothetical protein
MPKLQAIRPLPFDALLKLERRVSHDGLVSIGSNYYSVPDRTRRVVEVHYHLLSPPGTGKTILLRRSPSKP